MPNLGALAFTPDLIRALWHFRDACRERGVSMFRSTYGPTVWQLGTYVDQWTLQDVFAHVLRVAARTTLDMAELDAALRSLTIVLMPEQMDGMRSEGLWRGRGPRRRGFLRIRHPQSVVGQEFVEAVAVVVARRVPGLDGALVARLWERGRATGVAA